MKVILLAAGIGQRLQPITDDIPKPMIKIAGKPILEYILEDLLNFGFNDLCIVVGHEANQIKNYFSNWNKNSCSISFVTQNEYKGTAHAMYLAKDFVKNDPFLLYLADTIIPLDLNDKLSKMVSDVNSMSILSSKSFVNDSNSVGNVVVKDNFVKSISEKSGNSRKEWCRRDHNTQLAKKNECVEHVGRKRARWCHCRCRTRWLDSSFAAARRGPDVQLRRRHRRNGGRRRCVVYLGR